MTPAIKSGALCSAVHVLQIEVHLQFLKYAVGSNSSRAAIEPWFAKARNKLMRHGAAQQSRGSAEEQAS